MAIPSSVRVGSVYGSLTVVSWLGVHRVSGCNRGMWLCQCTCGNNVTVASGSLTTGNTKSCGCLRGVRHGDWDTRFYWCWANMKNRSRHHPGYVGIDVCPEWEPYDGFKADMYNEYVMHVAEYGEKDTTLDRIDNDKGYYK